VTRSWSVRQNARGLAWVVSIRRTRPPVSTTTLLTAAVGRPHRVADMFRLRGMGASLDPSSDMLYAAKKAMT
jgi:hypothetical protein